MSFGASSCNEGRNEGELCGWTDDPGEAGPVRARGGAGAGLVGRAARRGAGAARAGAEPAGAGRAARHDLLRAARARRPPRRRARPHAQRRHGHRRPARQGTAVHALVPISGQPL